MIIECPSCLTRYDTPAQIPEEGRNVRCAKCANVWLVRPDDEPLEPEKPKPKDATPAESEAEAAETAKPEEPTVDEGTMASAEAVEAAEREAEEEAAAEQDAAESQEPTVDEATMASAETAEADSDWLDTDDIDWGDDDEGEVAFADIETDKPEPEPELEPEPVEADASPVEAEPEVKPEAAPEAAVGDTTEAQADDEGAAEVPADDEGAAEAPPIVVPDSQPTAAASAMDSRMMAGWAGFAVFVVLSMTLLATQRVGVVSALPGAASLYRTLGMSVNVRGLDFDKVTSAWTVEAGRSILEIHGDIVNITDSNITVPTVVFALRNADGLEVYQWAAEVSNEPLASGERTPFVARIPTPPKSIKSVQVKFAKSR